MKGARVAGIFLAGAAALASTALPARAVDASVYLLTPTVTQGEREIDFHSGVGSAGSSTRHEEDAGIGFGAGVTDYWFTELAVQYRNVGHSGTTLDALEWENIIALAEPGQWPLDVGIAVEVEKPREAAEGYAVRIGPLLQKEFGLFQLNANVLFGRHFQTTEFFATQERYEAQFKYRYRQAFEYGLQAFGNLGNLRQSWTGYERQVHRVGPVVLGKFPLAGERSLSYNAAFLLGTTAHSPDRTARLQIEYEF